MNFVGVKPEVNRFVVVRRPDAEAGVSLRKRRAWFDDEGSEDGDREGQEQGQTGGDSRYNPATLDDANKIIDALLKRVKEREGTIDQLKQNSSSLDDRLKAIERDRKKKLEEEGNYKALLDQATAEAEGLRSYKERAEALDAIIRQGNEERIKRVPESMRSIIPVDYPPERLQAWLVQNETLLNKKPAPDFDAGAGGNGGSGGRGNEIQVTDIDRQRAEIAKSQGYDVTPESLAKRRLGLAD